MEKPLSSSMVGIRTDVLRNLVSFATVRVRTTLDRVAYILLAVVNKYADSTEMWRVSERMSFPILVPFAAVCVRTTLGQVTYILLTVVKNYADTNQMLKSMEPLTYVCQQLIEIYY